MQAMSFKSTYSPMEESKEIIVRLNRSDLPISAITLEILKNPVFLDCCGTSEEKDELEKWIRRNGKNICPLCNGIFSKPTTNRYLKNILEMITDKKNPVHDSEVLEAPKISIHNDKNITNINLSNKIYFCVNDFATDPKKVLIECYKYLQSYPTNPAHVKELESHIQSKLKANNSRIDKGILLEYGLDKDLLASWILKSDLNEEGKSRILNFLTEGTFLL